MNRIRKIILGILLFFCGVSLVWADDSKIVDLKWEYDDIYFNPKIVQTDLLTSDGFLVASYNSIQKFNAKTGFVKELKFDENAEVFFANRLNNSYIVGYTVDDVDTYISIDENLNIKKQVVIDDSYTGPYFDYYYLSFYDYGQVFLKDNKLYICNYYLSNFSIDENLNIESFDLEDDGTYFLYVERKFAKYYKYGEELKNIDLGCVSEISRHDGNYIVQTCDNRQIYVFDNNLNVIKKINAYSHYYFYTIDNTFYMRSGDNWHTLDDDLNIVEIDESPIKVDGNLNETSIINNILKQNSEISDSFSLQVVDGGYFASYIKDDEYYYGFFDNDFNLKLNLDCDMPAYSVNNYILQIDYKKKMLFLYDKEDGFQSSLALPDGFEYQRYFINYISDNYLVFFLNTIDFRSAEGPTYYDTVLLLEIKNEISTKNDGNGDVVSNKDKAGVGEEVYITIHPNEGYYLKSLTVVDVYGNKIEVVDNKFIMPNSDVTIDVTFEKVEGNPDTADIIFISIVALVACGVVYFVNRKKIKSIK